MQTRVKSLMLFLLLTSFLENSLLLSNLLKYVDYFINLNVIVDLLCLLFSTTKTLRHNI